MYKFGNRATGWRIEETQSKEISTDLNKNESSLLWPVEKSANNQGK